MAQPPHACRESVGREQLLDTIFQFVRNRRLAERLDLHCRQLAADDVRRARRDQLHSAVLFNFIAAVVHPAAHVVAPDRQRRQYLRCAPVSQLVAASQPSSRPRHRSQTEKRTHNNAATSHQNRSDMHIVVVTVQSNSIPLLRSTTPRSQMNTRAHTDLMAVAKVRGRVAATCATRRHAPLVHFNTDAGQHVLVALLDAFQHVDAHFARAQRWCTNASGGFDLDKARRRNKLPDTNQTSQGPPSTFWVSQRGHHSVTRHAGCERAESANDGIRTGTYQVCRWHCAMLRWEQFVP